MAHYLNDFLNLFLDRFISKMNNNSSEGKMFFVNYVLLMLKKIGQFSRGNLRSLQYLGYQENILIILL